MIFDVRHGGVWVRRSNFNLVDGKWAKGYVHTHQSDRPLILEKNPPFYEERDLHGRPVRQEYRCHTMSKGTGVAVYEYAYGLKGVRRLSNTIDPPHAGVIP